MTQSTQRDRLLAWLRTRPKGATDQEAATFTGIVPDAIRPRRGELVRLGLVRDSGRVRPTSRNCPARVWEAVR
jgi:hypothetical protein